MPFQRAAELQIVTLAVVLDVEVVAENGKAFGSNAYLTNRGSEGRDLGMGLDRACCSSEVGSVDSEADDGEDGDDEINVEGSNESNEDEEGEEDKEGGDEEEDGYNGDNEVDDRDDEDKNTRKLRTTLTQMWRWRMSSLTRTMTRWL